MAKKVPKSNKSLQVRLYPTLEQRQQLAQMFGNRRFVVNHLVGQNQTMYALGQPYLGKLALQAQISELRERYPFLMATSANELRHAVNDFDGAMQKLFAGTGKKPKFQGKYAKATITCSQGISFEHDMVSIEFLREIKASLGRQKIPQGILKEITITKVPSGRYFAGLVYELQPHPKPYTPTSVMGLDDGVKHIQVDDKGKMTRAARPLKKAKEKLAKAQRNLSRKHLMGKARAKAKGRKYKPSNNTKKQRSVVARLHEKVRRTRKFPLDLLAHNTTDKARRENQAIGIQNVKIQPLIKNRKLSHALSDAGMHYSCTRLCQESAEKGVPFFLIAAHQATSKLCSHCFNRHEELTLSDLFWRCDYCSHKHHRDQNAAQVIKAIVEAWLGLRTLERILYSPSVTRLGEKLSRVGSTRIYACMSDGKLFLSDRPSQTPSSGGSGDRVSRVGDSQSSYPISGAKTETVEMAEVAKRERKTNRLPHGRPKSTTRHGRSRMQETRKLLTGEVGALAQLKVDKDDQTLTGKS